MNTSKKLIAIIMSVLIFVSVTPAIAGNSCNPTKIDPNVLAHAIKHAEKLNNQLNQLHPQVALISRVGSDISKYGMRYTHVAFALKNFSSKTNNQWSVVHLLNQCGTNHSSLYAQGLLNFFMDDLYNMDYQITVPDKTTQLKILSVLRSPLAHTLHDNRYSMLAYPYSVRYQNSNQWVLEVIASALNNAHSRRDAQRVLANTGFQPSIIKLDGFTRLGASLFKASVAFDDHPFSEQASDQYSIVSVDSVIRYLHHQGKLLLNEEYRG